MLYEEDSRSQYYVAPSATTGKAKKNKQVREDRRMALEAHKEEQALADAAERTEKQGAARGSEDPVAGDSATEHEVEQAQRLAEMQGGRVKPPQQRETRPGKRR